jgi:hypothetical protein
MRGWFVWGGVAVLVLIVAVEPILQMFIAETAGTLLAALLDPIIWGLAFVSSLPRWRFQPWLGLFLGGCAGALLYFVYPAPAIDLADLPRFTGRVLAGVIPVLIFQAFRRARGEPMMKD